MADGGFAFDSLMIDDSEQIEEYKCSLALTLCPKRIKSVCLFGDSGREPLFVKHNSSANSQSMFKRMIRLGATVLNLGAPHDSNLSIFQHIADTYQLNPQDFSSVPQVNAGFSLSHQFINVADYGGEGESEPVPGVYQNLAEAEFVVACFQFMRLLEYPAKQISILTPYKGQKALIKDVLQRRCSWMADYFGEPASVCTIGEHCNKRNDCKNSIIIFSKDLITCV